MVQLTPKSEDELARWMPEMFGKYYEDLVSAGNSATQARENVDHHVSTLFPEGRAAAGQHVMNVLDGEACVGTLWLSQQGGEASTEWFVYDVEVDEAFRGRGLGRSTMEAAEAYVRARGGVKLGLSVFGNNPVAQSLYNSLGYRVLAQSMYKELE